MDNPAAPTADMDTDPKAAALPAAASPPPPAKSSWRGRVLMFGLPLVLIIAGGLYWLTSGGSVSTDNAYVQMDKVSVATEVGGRIVEVAVRDGQQVAAGTLLFRIDPEPYRLVVAQATAAIDAARVQVGTLAASASAASVDIAKAQADIDYAETVYRRQEELLKQGFTTRAAYDTARHAVTKARAALRQAEADTAEAKARLATGRGGFSPQVEAAQVQQAQAAINLGRTEIRAPSAGRVAQADRLQIGQMMVAGLPALTLVDTQHAWVEANFKETDLAHMRVGQRAEIRFDAYPGIKLRGHVVSIGAGTGSEFSVLPAQNATGNWVKVTQRVPVRIAFDETPARAMIAGLSSEVEVFTGKPRK